MNIKLKYFGMIAEAIGSGEEAIEFEGNTVGELDALIRDRHDAIKDMNYKIAVNQSLVDNSFDINNNDEIALLPPFAGG